MSKVDNIKMEYEVILRKEKKMFSCLETIILLFVSLSVTNKTFQSIQNQYVAFSSLHYSKIKTNSFFRILHIKSQETADVTHFAVAQELFQSVLHKTST